jgi:imidazolonepropionase-like amidohydrolase
VRQMLYGFLIGASLTATLAHAAHDATHGTTAFVHVNVVPMDRERVLHDQTVIITGDEIDGIGRHLQPPAGAQVIDGHGTAWLSPGLADMHTHSESRNDLAVYLINGVTTVLHMGGARAGFVDNIVPAANAGTIPAPHVYTSFLVDGSTDYNGFVIKTPAQARAIVGLAKTNGYDFIKVYVGLAPDVFAALADEGRLQNMPLVGHGVTAVRLEHQLAAGQVMVAHAEEFFYTYFTPAGVEESDIAPDVSRIPAAVALAKKYHAAVTADLATYAAIAHQMQRPDIVAGFLATPQSTLLSPGDRLAWRNSSYLGRTAKLEAKLAFLRSLVKAMADGGVELLTGTDAPAVPGMLPGFSLHDDLDELEASGLTRFQVLSAATREPGEFIARTKGGMRFGVLAPGYRADLLLTRKNPLDSLATLSSPLGVMMRGQWRNAAALDALKDEVRERYRSAAAAP